MNTNEKNVISLEKYKNQKGLAQELKNYQEYLTYLDTHQLEAEVNHFLINLNQIDFNNMNVEKFQFLLEEMANRTTNAFAKSIQLIKENLLKKIRLLQH